MGYVADEQAATPVSVTNSHAPSPAAKPMERVQEDPAPSPSSAKSSWEAEPESPEPHSVIDILPVPRRDSEIESALEPGCCGALAETWSLGKVGDALLIT